MKKNRVLILGSQFEMSGLVRKAKARGYYTVVLDGYADGTARQFADRAYTVDVRDYDAVAAICQKENIDHIVTSYSDILFEAWVNIADRTGVPCYIQRSGIANYRDKTVMKKNMEKLGIGVSKYVILQDGFTKQEISKVNFPAVLKPIDSCGSRGMHVVFDEEEVRTKLTDSAHFSDRRRGTVILEELCTGQELNCQACVVDGMVKLISIADRLTGFYRKDTIPINYANVYPSGVFNTVKNRVCEIFSAYANDTGQKWGPISMQCFWDGESIKVCEIAGRFFGYEHELVQYSNGLDLDELLLDLQYDRNAVVRTFQNFDPYGDKCAIGIYETVVGKGILTDQKSLVELQNYEGVVESDLFFEDGTIVDFFQPKQYAARYYLVGECRRSVLSQMKSIVQSAVAYNEKNENVLYVPNFDVKKCVLQEI